MSKIKHNSEIIIDDLKYNPEKKRNLLIEVIKLKVFCPVAVYVSNTNMPDICKCIFFLHRFYPLDKFINKLKLHLDSPCDKKLVIKTEEMEDETSDVVLDDICFGELYEYEKNNDGFLYLKLDCEK